MQLAKFSIRRSVTTTMIYLIVVGFGIFSLTQLKIDLFPNLSFPVIAVITNYRGVGPEDIENLVTRPLEGAVSATANVETVSSQSMEGTSLIILEFAWGSDMDVAETDVRNRIDMVRDYLPDEADAPLVVAFDPSLMPVMYLSLSSPNLGSTELRNLAETKVQPLLERVEGVASVSTIGGLQRQINVKLNPILLSAYRLSPDDVVTALRRQAGLFPAGKIETSTRKFNLRLYSEFQSIDAIRETVLKLQDGLPVLVKDVAEVEDGYQESLMDVRVNAKSGIALLISKQSDANTVQTAAKIKKALPGITALLPQGTQFSTIFDQSEFILLAVGNLSNTAMIAFGLTVAVIYIFLRNWRGSVIMGVSIPVSVVVTFGVLMLAGLTLNVISMAGLALAIGMLVDNSIVALENIYRHRQMGKSMTQAADEGASEIGMPIIASTLTTLAVFLPVLFVPGITGQLFRDMVITISFSLSVSLLVALTLVPMMSSKMLHAYSAAERARQGWFKRLLDGLFDKGLTRIYGAILHWAIHHKLIVIVLVIAAFIGSLLLVPSLGGDFMPRNDEGMIQFDVNMAAGTPLVVLRQMALRVEQIIAEEVPERDSLFVNFGEQEGFGAMGGGTSSTIQATIRLTPIEERERSQFAIEDRLRERLVELPGVTFTIAQNQGVGFGGKAIAVKVIGHDLDRARLIADQIKTKMEQVKGFVDVELNVTESLPQLQVHLDQNVLNDFHLSGLQVASIVSTAIEGKTAVTYREAGDEYDVNVRLAPQYRQDREALAELLIPVLPDTMVPLRQLGVVEEALAPATIFRENQDRYISVECNLSGIDLTRATQAVRTILAETPIPSDFTVVIGGNAQDQQEANRYLGISFVVAIVLVYMVMASQFESLVDPFIIMFTVPLSVIGVFGFLYLTHTTLSVMALVGLVMLVGIAVNNGIVLVAYTNQLRARGEELYQAVEECGAARLRPVLMTALTTILGMTPLALELGAGSESWSPLARAVIGGLTTTTLLTLIVIPVLYIIFERIGEQFRKIFMRTKVDHRFQQEGF
jgi:HAE1 family hydrophobic/amphiphilic exporter-1